MKDQPHDNRPMAAECRASLGWGRSMFAVAMVCVLGISCARSGRPGSGDMNMRQKQEAALEDPFGYHVGPMPRAGGGKIDEFDKEGFQRDVDRVVNP